MTDASTPRMVSVPVELLETLIGPEIETGHNPEDWYYCRHCVAAWDVGKPGGRVEKHDAYCPVAKVRALLAQAPSPAPAASAPAEAKLLAEIAYHRRMATKYVRNEDAWYAHISLEQVVADKLSLLRREAHWQDKLAQALAPAEGEG